MADTHVAAQIAVQIASSGVPNYLGSSKSDASKWPSGSGLLSALLSVAPSLTVTPRREMVFLTRSQQRIMDRALRASLKIIA